LKLLQKTVGKTLEHIDIGNTFLTRTPMAQQLRERIDKSDYRKLKSSCTAKGMVTRVKKQPTKWERVFASFTTDKGLITRIYRKLKKLNSQRIPDPMKKWANALNRNFSKEDI
jgi:uncharacterized protein YPO0396